MASKSASQRFELDGFYWPHFLIVFLILAVALWFDAVPGGMIMAGVVMIMLGAVLNTLGNTLPIIREYFGGGPIVVIFGSAALIYSGILPDRIEEDIVGSVTDFMKKQQFLGFYIAALITGSILGMNRQLMISAALRYLPVILGGVIVSFLLTGVCGWLMGEGFSRSMLYIAMPIMGGGMGAGAVPLSEIYGEALNEDPTKIMSIMVPALALGNAFAVVTAGLLNHLGHVIPSLTGNGRLLKTQQAETFAESAAAAITFKDLGIGMLLSMMFLTWGSLLAVWIPLHSFALMIISVALVKAFGIMPAQYERAAYQWFQLVLLTMTSALLVGIGIAYTDLNEVIQALSWFFVILVAATVLGAVVGSAFIGYFLGFYPIEAAITAGLCMANMGGTGDVAVLSACRRMELMPFAQISSRLGGAFMLILATALLYLLGG